MRSGIQGASHGTPRAEGPEERASIARRGLVNDGVDRQVGRA
jgi:hypothetical protein